MKYWARATNGRLDFGDYNIRRLQKELKENEGARYCLQKMTPESKKQRGFFEGAVIPLWAYLNGMEYRDSETCDWLRDEAKREFNGEYVQLDGKLVKRGKSTKGVLNHGFLDRVIDYLEEQYAIDRTQVLNPESYKHYMAKIYPNPKAPATYIEYLESLGLLRR